MTDFSWADLTTLRQIALAREVRSLMPPRTACSLAETSDVAELVCGERDEGSLVVLFLPERIEFRFLVVLWPLPHSPQLDTCRWREVAMSKADAASVLQAIGEWPKAWKRRLRRCKHCRELLPPERLMWIEKKRVCHGCATEHEGVIF
jgi:hypothetical protein